MLQSSCKPCDCGLLGPVGRISNTLRSAPQARCNLGLRIHPRSPQIIQASAKDMAAFDDPRLDKIAKAIRTIPNFPKPGIMFYDICSLLLEPEVFQTCIDVLVERYKDQHVDVVAGTYGTVVGVVKTLPHRHHT